MCFHRKRKTFGRRKFRRGLSREQKEYNSVFRRFRYSKRIPRSY